jgi:hypothetical protein
MRSRLVFVAARGLAVEAELFGSNRTFDVAYNDFTGSGSVPDKAEFKLSKDVWAFRLFARDLYEATKQYSSVAFLNDDIGISTSSINKLFDIGESMGLGIWQAAFSDNSVTSWPHLKRRDGSSVRRTNEIELAMPFFSRLALDKCIDTFDITDSAWGIEAVWDQRCDCFVVDSVTADHFRPIESSGRLMPSGLYPMQEADIVLDMFKVDRKRVIY